LTHKELAVEQILALLAVAPPRIVARTAGLADDRLRAAPGPGEWSANEVLAHMRACADVWGGCIATILEQDLPVLRAVNPRTWIKKTDYLEQEFAPSLQAFTRQRAGLLAVLEALPPEAWQRAATVRGAGKPLVRTVHAYAQWLATHERPHVRQIERTLHALSSSA
jgi:hypothetical protein